MVVGICYGIPTVYCWINYKKDDGNDLLFEKWFRKKESVFSL